MNSHFFFYRRDGLLMFRIFGYGFHWATYKAAKPYYSERNGYRKPLFKTNKWRVFFLSKYELPEYWER